MDVGFSLCSSELQRWQARCRESWTHSWGCGHVKDGRGVSGIRSAGGKSGKAVEKAVRGKLAGEGGRWQAEEDG